MKALLIKEWLVIWNQGKFLILLALAYCIMAVTGSGYFFAGFSVIFMSMLPISGMGWDERSKWDHYALTMPYTRKDMVLSKYVFSILCAFAAILVYIIATIVKCYIEKQPFDFLDLINQAGLLLSAGLIFSIINYPILFKFGVEKGRLLFILMTVIIASVSSTLLAFVKADPVKIESFVQKVTVFMLPVSVVLLLVSAALSIRIYEKREF